MTHVQSVTKKSAEILLIPVNMKINDLNNEAEQRKATDNAPLCAAISARHFLILDNCTKYVLHLKPLRQFWHSSTQTNTLPKPGKR